MGQNLKKRISKLIAIPLIFSLAAACSNNKDESQGKQGQENNNEVFEYKWLSNHQPFEDGTWGQKWMEETFGIKMQVVRLDEEKYNEQLGLMIATGDIPDLMRMDTLDRLPQMVKSDLLAELPEALIKETMPKFYEIIKEADPNAFSYGNVNGISYALPLPDGEARYPYSLAIRGDWLKKVGAKVPTTLQEFEDVFLKFRNDDPDGNGKKDTYALSMPSDFTSGFNWFHPFFGAFGTNPFLWHNRDGKMVYGFTEEGTKEGLKLLNKWYKEGIIDPEFFSDKHRTNSNNDIAYKFASGKIGYMDNVTFEDYQWDNDGHVNSKWVANNPQWQEFFKTKDPNVIYQLKPFTEVPDSGSPPVYLNIQPPTGPDGKSGVFKDVTIKRYILFSKSLQENPVKLKKLLGILEQIGTDEEMYVTSHFGPEGQVWKYNDQKQRIFNEEFRNSELYHPQYRKMGTGQYTNPMFRGNYKFLPLIGGQRAVQRYSYFGDDYAAKLPAIEDALKGILPSRSKYTELPTMLKEYFIKAIIGDVNIDETFDKTVKQWKASGGDELTKEADVWLSGMK
jgi:putative aldouronate transport system substrate-binding protein